MSDRTPRPRVSRRYFLQLGALTGLASTTAILAACAPAASTPTTAPAPIATTAPVVAAPTATTAPKPTAAPAATTAPAPTAATAAATATTPPKPTTAAVVTPASEVAGIVAPKAAKGELAEQTIVISIASGPEADAHTRLSAAFTEYTKGKVKTRIDEQVRGTAGDAKVLATFQGKSDAWDVVNFTTTNVSRYAKAGFFADLKKFQSDPNLFDAKAFNLEDWPAGLRAIHTLDGISYAYVQEASTLMFFYRKDLLKQYGVPEPPAIGYSWTELAKHCLTLKDKLKADGKTDVFPMLFGVKATGHAAINGLQPIWSYGQEVLDDKNVPTMDTPKSVAAMTMMTDFLFKDAVVSPGVVGYEYPEVLTAYQQGKAVMALQWNASAADILNPTKSPLTAANTGFSVYPYDATAGPNQARVYPSVWGSGVSAFSKKQEAAFEYITWFMSKDIAKDYVTKGGGSSGRASLLADPKIVEANPQYPAMLNGFKVYHGWPSLIEFQYVYASILNPLLGEVWSKQKSVADGLKKIQAETVTYFKDQGVK